MTEKERITPTEKEIPLVFGYGLLLGIREMLRQMQYSEEDRETADKMFYEKNIVPTADMVRQHFGITNAVSFDPVTLEFIIFAEQADEVGFKSQP